MSRGDANETAGLDGYLVVMSCFLDDIVLYGARTEAGAMAYCEQQGIMTATVEKLCELAAKAATIGQDVDSVLSVQLYVLKDGVVKGLIDVWDKEPEAKPARAAPSMGLFTGP